jgi:hypothetical protein
VGRLLHIGDLRRNGLRHREISSRTEGKPFPRWSICPPDLLISFVFSLPTLKISPPQLSLVLPGGTD